VALTPPEVKGMGKDRKSYGKPTEAFSRSLAERTASGLRLDNMMKVRIAVLLFGLGINREMQDPVIRSNPCRVHR